VKTLRTVWLKFGSLWRRSGLRGEIDEELRFHLEQRTAENVAAGMSPENAARLARKCFGNFQTVREQCREASRASFGEACWQDARFGARMLRKSPGFAVAAVLTLALGIGANTAIFSIMKAVLLRSLPYRDPERLVTVCESNLKRGYAQILVTPANLRQWQKQNSVFEQLGGEIYESYNLTGTEQPEHLHAACTTPNFFSIFGVPPLLGRTFVAADQPPGGERVAVLSYGLWKRRFAGDRDVIGKIITLSGENFTIVGIMPASFKIFPTPVFGLPTGRVDPELWVPYSGSMDERDAHFFVGFGRLKPGVQLSAAQSEMSAIAARLDQESGIGHGWDASVQPLHEQVVGNSRSALRLLLGAVGFVLLIACANVANLSLARSIARGREFAIRSALGAGRGRLIRQRLVESTLLGILGGSLGVMLARASLAGLLALQPANLPRLDEVQLDGSVLGFTLVVSVLAGLLFGLAPALHSSTPDFHGALKETGAGASTGHRPQRARSFLVVAEVALAMVLLVGAGLMINSFARLARVNPGFEPERLITFDASLPWPGYVDDAKRMRLIAQLRARVQALPGVTSAATAYGLPFGTMLNATCGVLIEGRSTSEPRERISSAWRTVSPGYFKTMGVPVRAGRAFSERLDTQNSGPTVVINETFARKFFPGDNPLGKRIQVFTVSTNWSEIIGVIQDVKLTGLDAPTAPEIYQPDTQQGPWMFSLVVRSRLPSRQIESEVRTEAAAIEKDLPLFNVRTMGEAISASVASQRFTMTLISLFATLALILSAVGIYGVVSYSVSQRTREIGIRMALGAPRRSVLGLVLQEGLLLATLGVGIGLAGSLALTRFMASQLFGVSATDPATFLVVTALVVSMTIVSSYLPARRAAKVDPLLTLRYE